MKIKFLSFLVLFLTLKTNAQSVLIQTGLVREQNSGKKPVDNVQIIFSNSVPATSDNSGNFTLAFQGKKPGDFVFMNEVSKKGFELVNDKELQNVKLSSDAKLGTDIIVAREGTIDAAKKEYYAISDKALKAGYEREKKRLQDKLQDATLTAQQYQEQFDNIQKQYDNQKKQLDELSEKFAKVNFDDVSPLYQKALELFKDGKIDEAIILLKSANLNQQTAKILKEGKNISEQEKDLAERKTVYEKKQKEQIETIQLLAQLYASKFERDSAAAQYDQLLLLDSTNLDILQACADFFKENNFYEKAINTYQKVIAHPNVLDFKIVEANSFLGDLWQIMGKSDSSLTFFTKMFDVSKEMHQKNTLPYYQKDMLTIALDRLGTTYTILGNLDKALELYEESFKLKKELFSADPAFEYKTNLGWSNQFLGKTHSSLGNFQKSLGFYEEMNKIFKEQYTAFPIFPNIKKGLAISYQLLGITQTTLGNLDKALAFYEQFNSMEKQLYASFPNDVEFKNNLAVSYQYLGTTHRELGNLDKALGFYEEFNKLESSLYSAYPNNVKFKNGLAISYQDLGYSHMALGDLIFYAKNREEFDMALANLHKALAFYEQFNSIEKQLYDAYPNNVEFKNNLAVSFGKLGETQNSLGNLDKALGFYEEDLKISKELYAAYPNNVEFKNNLAISFEKLGVIQKSLGNLDKALGFYEEETKLFKELYAAYPNNVEFKNNLAISFIELGNMQTSLGNLDNALGFYEEHNRLSKEFYESDPNNVKLKEGLAISFKTIGGFYEEYKKNNVQAKKYYFECEKIYKELFDTLRKLTYLKSLKWVQEKLEALNKLPSIFDLEKSDQPLKEIKGLIANIDSLKTNAEKVDFQTKLVNVFENLLSKYKGNNADTSSVSQLNGNLAWYQLFKSQFPEAEKSALRGLTLDTSQTWIKTNLAHALLFQNKYTEAEKVYLELKPLKDAQGNSYAKGCLDDLDALEKVDITHKDVAKIRALLKE